MTTSEPLSNGGSPNPDQPSISSAGGSHASRSPTPDSCSESPTSAGRGRGWKPSYAEFDPDTFWWRTFQLWFEMSELSEPPSVTFTSSGSMRNGQLYERPTSEHHIRVDGSTCWPTPRATGADHMITWARVEKGIHRSQLEDYLGCQHMAAGGQRVSGLNVNPEWIDWLMGFPPRWTDCESSVTPLSPQSQSSSGDK
jgi:hypothetical protein